MTDIAKMMKDLQTRRDEWQGLTEKWDKFLTRAQFDKSAEEVGEAAREVGLKMKAAYDRLKKAT